MTRDVRRFAVNDRSGVSFTVIERADFVTTEGREVQVGVSSFATVTGWTVAALGQGEYRIERLRLAVREGALSPGVGGR